MFQKQINIYLPDGSIKLTEQVKTLTESACG